MNLTECRALEQQGRSDEVVWASLRAQNAWRRAAVTADAADRDGATLQAQWQGFLNEARAVRFGAGASVVADEEAPAEQAEDEPMEPPAQPDDGDGGTVKERAASAAKAASPAEDAFEVSLLSGLVCEHGLISRPRSGFLVRRSKMTRLLELAAAKEHAYQSLWPEARAVPRMRTGLPCGELLGFGDVCLECRADGGGARPGASPAHASGSRARQARNITVRRKYVSGAIRKQGIVTVPEGQVPTGAALRAAVREKFRFQVLHVFQPGANLSTTGKEVSEHEVLATGVDNVIVEKDETAPPEREAAAFEGSVFRTATS